MKTYRIHLTAEEQKKLEQVLKRLKPPLPAKMTPLHVDHFFHQGA